MGEVQNLSSPSLILIIVYFLEISPRRDLISKLCTMRWQFEGGVYRDRHVRAYTASISLYSYAHIMRVYICRLLATPYHVARFRGRCLLGWASWNMWRDFEGSGISRCGEIPRKYSNCYYKINATIAQRTKVGYARISSVYAWEHLTIVCMTVCWPHDGL